ncbi:MAG TPA: carbohydrate ABC transporter permease [Chloroflexota bacterium]|nr:carbohydrate ABC transporter permease [Chloroflexota bacterium]
MAARAHEIAQERAEARLGGVNQPLLYAAAVVLTLLFITPFFWTVSISLKQIKELFQFPPLLLPETPQWGNYVQVWTRVPFGKWVVNTFIITGSAMAGTLLTASLVAYSFARYKYPGRDLFFIATLSTMMLPAEVTIIPQYLGFRQLDLLDTFWPLIIPAWLGGGAFYIFLLRQFFMTIPRDLDDAARIDGASGFQIFWNVMLPLAKPALATVAVISFIANWDEFLRPLIYLNTTEKFPLSVGLRFFNNRGNETDPLDHLLMAAAVMVTAPCLVLFFCTQRYFVRGVITSGIKG